MNIKQTFPVTLQKSCGAGDTVRWVGSWQLNATTLAPKIIHTVLAAYHHFARPNFWQKKGCPGLGIHCHTQSCLYQTFI